jgi:branched-chain amino acid transport system substrate-binding protein
MKQMIAAAAASAALVLGLGACSSSGPSPDSTSADSPITVGVVGSFSGSFSAQYGGDKPAIEAWASYTNARGGIAGHLVKLIVMDDGGSAGQSLLDVKQLVQSDHVAAIVAPATAQDAVWGSYVRAQGIPVIGGYQSDNNVDNPMFFPVGTAATSRAPNGLVMASRLAKSTRVGLVYCVEQAACTGTIAVFKQVTPAVHMSLVYTGAVSSAAPGYTAQCLAAQSAQVGVLVAALDPVTLGRFATDCTQQGFNPIYTDSTVTASMLTVSALNNHFAFISPDFLYYDNSLPAEKAFHLAIEKYAPSLPRSPEYGETVAVAWVSGQALAAAVTASGAKGTITATDIKNGLYSLQNDTLGNLAPPLTYVRNGANTKVVCWFEGAITNGQLSAPFGSKPICPPPS